MAEFALPFTLQFGSYRISSIPVFSAMLIFAFLSAVYMVPRELNRRGLNPGIADICIFLTVIGTIVGSKLGFALEIWDRIWVIDEGFFETFYYVFFTFDGMGSKLPGEAVGFWEAITARSGLAFYGGFIFTFILVYSYLRIKKLPVWEYADAFMPALAFGYGIGRLGCMISGDGCYGYAAHFEIPFLTTVFGPGSIMNSSGVVVWNTPLIESLFSFGLFYYFISHGRLKRFRPGMYVALFLVMNGTVRFFIEFLRLNEPMLAILPPPNHDGQELLHHYAMNINPPAYYFLNWHWYGVTQGQLFGAILAIIGLSWIKTKKLYQEAGNEDMANHFPVEDIEALEQDKKPWERENIIEDASGDVTIKEEPVPDHDVHISDARLTENIDTILIPDNQNIESSESIEPKQSSRSGDQLDDNKANSRDSQSRSTKEDNSPEDKIEIKSSKKSGKKSRKRPNQPTTHNRTRNGPKTKADQKNSPVKKKASNKKPGKKS